MSALKSGIKKMKKKHKDAKSECCSNKKCCLNNKTDLDALAKQAHAQGTVLVMPIIDRGYAFTLGAKLHVPSLEGELLVAGSTKDGGEKLGTICQSVISALTENKIKASDMKDGYVIDAKCIGLTVDITVIIVEGDGLYRYMGSAMKLTCVEPKEFAYLLVQADDNNQFSLKHVKKQMRVFEFQIAS